MISPEHLPNILNALPFLRNADRGLIRDFQQSAFVTRIPAGKDVFVEVGLGGTTCMVVAIVGAPLSGPKIRAAR